MKAAELRASILQEAVSGKLVPQIAAEGTADELLKQIEAERAALIKAGKIKIDKPLPEITEDEIPFEIPRSWRWVRIEEIFNVRSAMRIHQSDWKSSGIPFFRGRELVKLSKNESVDFEVYISRELYEFCKMKGGVPQKDDILISAVGTIGKVYVVKGTKEFYYKDAYVLCFENIGKIYPYYVKYALECPYMQREIKRDSMATTVSQLTIMKAKSLYLPLPPLSEQKRIVAKLEEILPLIDLYGEEEEKLSALSALFPDAMRKSILQEAVSGKLVPQIAAEGTADELLKQIEAERAALIKAGKIKIEKPLPEITEDEIPFEIPRSWRWVRLGNIGTWAAGGTPSRSHQEYFTNGSIFWVKSGDLNDDKISTTEEKITQLAIENSTAKINPIGSVILAMYGATIGKTGILSVEAATNQACCACKPYRLITNAYLQIYLISQKKGLVEAGWGSAQPNISREIIINYPIPLPPLSEQKRIVSKIEELMGIIDEINRTAHSR